MDTTEEGTETHAVGGRVISGQPIGLGGRIKPSTFPAFPQASRPHTACPLPPNLLYQSFNLASVVELGLLHCTVSASSCATSVSIIALQTQIVALQL